MVSTANSIAEETPLLSSPTSSTRRASSPSPSASSSSVHPRKSANYVIAFIIAFCLFIGVGDELIQPAQTRVIESIYCRQYYEKVDPGRIGGDGWVEERFCKGSKVQGQVASLKAWALSLDGAGMLFLSVPWGYFADTYGRRPVILLLTLGFWLKSAWVMVVLSFWQVFPLELVWLGSLSVVLGGGISVANAMIFTLVSDVVPESGRVQVFFFIAAAGMSTQFVGPFTSAILMMTNPWIPMFLGLALQLGPLFLYHHLPETLDYNNIPSVPSSTLSSPGSSIRPDKRTRTERIIEALQESYIFLMSDKRILLIFPAFFVQLILFSRDVLMQYISVRYQVSLARATVLISIRSGLIFVLNLVLWPLLTWLLRTKWHVHPQKADLLLARSSVLVMSIGFLFIALAPTLPLAVVALIFNTFGWGLALFLRSLMVSLVEGHHIARLNSFLGTFETTGLMFGGPLLALVFKTGVEMGGLWVGLPYFACAALAGLIGFFLAFVGKVGVVNGDGSEVVEGEGDDEEEDREEDV
ncbi:MFS transporter [Venturia nashicola]|uniref:MFS transporter n=1 Tax=Venturia nashicola TaxID=86259 RepID=A0A4Z1P550_9PEZI|nr:MFS transporter [Venturia nashicola]